MTVLAKIAPRSLGAKLMLTLAGVTVTLALLSSSAYLVLDHVKLLTIETTANQTWEQQQVRGFHDRLSDTMTDIALLERSFFGAPDHLRQVADQVQTTLIELNQTKLTTSDSTGLSRTREALQLFVDAFPRFHRQATNINLLAEELTLAISRLHTQLSVMEQQYANAMITAAAHGVEIIYHEQMMALISAHRQQVLQLEKYHAARIQRMLNRSPMAWHQPMIIQSLNQLRQQLAKMNFDTARNHLIATALSESIDLFDLISSALSSEIRQFHGTRMLLLTIRNELEEGTKLLEQEQSAASQALASRLALIITETRTKALIGSLVAVTIFFVLLRSLIRRAIEQPLRGLLDGIERFRQGDLDHPIALNRNDEWSEIEEALNRMAHDLGRSYQALDQQKSHMDELAHHDTLTGLPNRLLFDDRLAHVLNRQQRGGEGGALLFMDLDRFKHINDSLGHAAGDQLLKTVSERILKTIRSTDTPSRQGGDEFLILLEGATSTALLSRLAEKLLAAISEPMMLEGQQLVISGSIGISVFPTDGSDPATLLRNADAAMYNAKQCGRNAYRFYRSAMTEQATEYLRVQSELRQALQKDELRVYYQPKFDLQNGRIVGAEALVRWQHPQQGLLSPIRFIPIAEQTGLVTAIDHWVLARVCHHMSHWRRRWGEKNLLPISVNLSGRQLEQRNMARTIAAIVEASNCPASMLELELTESYLSTESSSAAEAFSLLRGLGFKLAIDDFGTGYSSMTSLKRLPFDTLKIDASFVRGLPECDHDAAIVRSVVTLGNHMSLSVIAEGVETAEQARFLINNGCISGQGFLYSEAVPSDIFEEMQAEQLNLKSGQRLSEDEVS